MFPIAPDETLVETKICKHCRASFPITDKDIEFYEKVSPVFNGKKYSIPTPKLCPDCRQQRRLSFRNERKLYKRKCNATGENIISIYSPDKPYIVYNQDFWWSDKWNPMDYGREFDFSRPFFEQFEELKSSFPRCAILNGYNENAEYTNHGWKSKNCYLCIWFWDLEGCAYCSNAEHNRNCFDSDTIFDSENCFENFNVSRCFDCQYVYFSEDITTSVGLFECYNCSYCLGCVHLRNAKFQIFNKQVSEKEFHLAFQELQNPINRADFMDKFQKLIAHSTRVSSKQISTEDCTGNLLKNTKHCTYCFDCTNCQNVKYWFELRDSKDCYDAYVWGETPNNVYEGHCITGFHILFSNIVWGGQSLIYCDQILEHNDHLFGCVGLRNASYCILNKQYTKEEYEILVPKIIEHMMTTGEWWEFFPSSLSPFGYNETVAQEYFPMSREEVLNGHPELVSGSASVLGQKEYAEISSAWREVSLRGVEWNETTKQSSVPLVPFASGTSGSPHFVRDDEVKKDSETFLHWPIFNWSDYESPFPKVDKIIPARKLPEDISSIPDDILNWAIECEVTGKPFRVIPQELEFYRKHHLPIPRRHPDQRHLDRMKMRNPRKLFERKCDQCGKKMITTYSPDRKELVFCENCYNTTVLS